jgi:hypothetical protein
MAIKRFEGKTGTTVSVEYESAILADNPLGDPARREFHVWLPPGYNHNAGHDCGKRFPVLYDLVGYTGSGQSHTNWQCFDENVPKRAGIRTKGPSSIPMPNGSVNHRLLASVWNRTGGAVGVVVCVLHTFSIASINHLGGTNASSGP